MSGHPSLETLSDIHLLIAHWLLMERVKATIGRELDACTAWSALSNSVHDELRSRGLVGPDGRLAGKAAEMERAFEERVSRRATADRVADTLGTLAAEMAEKLEIDS